jgi:C4-dicarboxylate transporter DctM subunit
MNQTSQIHGNSKVALIEDIIGGIFLLGLAVVPVLEVVVRKISGSGLVWTSGFLQHIVVWVAWVGGITASREDAHLSLSSTTLPSGGFWNVINIIKNVASSSINMAFAVASASFLVLGFAPGESVGILPIRLILIILPLGYLSMSLRALWRPGGKPSGFLILGIFLGLVFSWPSVVNLLGAAFINLPFAFFDTVDLWYSFFRLLRWPLIGLILFLGARGLPIYLMLGGTALLLFSGNWGALESLPNEAYNLLTGNMIPAIPLFTVAGYLLSECSSGKRLVRFFRAALGWLPGGLAVVAVVACAYFTTFTGASGVTILALGGLLASVLIESGQYGKDFSRGLITSSGSVGLLFPPALPIIMYGVTAQISIKDMFLGGLLPGILLVVALSSMGVYRAVRSKAARTPFVFKEFKSAFTGAAGDLLLPVILLASYFGGLTNVVETAALAVVYTLLLTAVTRELSLDLISRVLRRGIPVIGGVLVILAMAKGLSYFIIDAQVPTMLTAFFRDHISSRFVFLILLNLALLITGTLMDIYSAILVVAPLIIPLGELYGVHPVQLGIIFLANLQLGYLTPPVGMNLFLASYTFEEPMNRVYRQIVPFLVVLLVAVLLITYVPWFSLALLG